MNMRWRMLSRVKPELCPILVLLCGALLHPAITSQLEAAEPPPDPWFASHAYISMDGCVAVGKEHALKPGDRVTLFEARQPVATRRIAYLVEADSAKEVFDRLRFDGVYADRALWSRIGAYWGLRAFESPFQLAHIDPDPPPDESGFPGYPLAIEGLPATAIAFGGDGTPLSAAELMRLRLKLDSPSRREYSEGRVLRAGFRYGSRGHELLEVYLGRPWYNERHGEAPIDSIHILCLYLYNGRELASNFDIRVSGQEEHVDLEPPQLDGENWFQTSIETLGFISLDNGKSWLTLNRDTGFEGIDWRIWELSERSRLLWDCYLYTSH